MSAASPGRTHLQELELVGVVRGLTAVDEVDPGEVVEVAVLAGHDEAGGDGGGELARDAAVLVDVLHPVGPVGVGLQDELVAAQRGQAAAAGAEHPPGERGHRHPHVGLLLERVRAVRVGHDGRRTQGVDLGPEDVADRRQEPLLGQLPVVAVGPVLQPHDHDRDVRQIDDRADAERREHLAGPQLADPRLVTPLAHRSPPRRPAATFTKSASSSRLWSSRIRNEVGSTSRSEFRQVYSSHASIPGLCSRPIVSLSFLPS